MKLFIKEITTTLESAGTYTLQTKRTFILAHLLKKLIPKPKDFDLIKYVEAYLSRRGYVLSAHKLGVFYTKGFTYVIINETTKEVIVSNDKSGKKGSFVNGITDLITSVNYYERI